MDEAQVDEEARYLNDHADETTTENSPLKNVNGLEREGARRGHLPPVPVSIVLEPPSWDSLRTSMSNDSMTLRNGEPWANKHLICLI